MYTFVKNHGSYKKGDVIETHQNIDYLQKVGVVIKLIENSTSVKKRYQKEKVNGLHV
jgi:hypothetical protein